MVEPLNNYPIHTETSVPFPPNDRHPAGESRAVAGAVVGEQGPKQTMASRKARTQLVQMLSAVMALVAAAGAARPPTPVG